MYMVVLHCYLFEIVSTSSAKHIRDQWNHLALVSSAHTLYMRI